MNIRFLATQLRPSTMAAMIADLLDSPIVNAEVITAMLEQLRHDVGDEGMEEFLADEGIVPGRAALLIGATQ